MSKTEVRKHSRNSRSGRIPVKRYTRKLNSLYRCAIHTCNRVTTALSKYCLKHKFANKTLLKGLHSPDYKIVITDDKSIWDYPYRPNQKQKRGKR